MSKPPAFQFYPDDFIGGVADMTQNEVGAYILLLCHQWNRGSIPAEPERQQMIAKGQVSEHVRAKFKTGADGLLKNDRLETERQKQADYREKQRQKGILSAQSRASARQPRFNHGSTTAQPSGQPQGNSLSPSPYPTKLKALTPAGRELAERFESLLGKQWVNDAGKWVNRIKEIEIIDGVAQHRPGWFVKCERVLGELKSAVLEKRIKTTPAAYAEDTWGRFK